MALDRRNIMDVYTAVAVCVAEFHFIQKDIWNILLFSVFIAISAVPHAEGKVGVIIPHGVLFRGAAEGKIRQFLIEKKNYIDAIIGLPANIFYGTSIPTCILVMKKCRKEDDNILFIDASKEFEKVKTQNKLRQEHIDKIVSTYRERKEIEKYSHCASLQEIKDNDYNLNIPRYVDTFEEEEEIDIKAVMSEIKELEAKRAELDAQIDVYLKELGII